MRADTGRAFFYFSFLPFWMLSAQKVTKGLDYLPLVTKGGRKNGQCVKCDPSRGQLWEKSDVVISGVVCSSESNILPDGGLTGLW